jgi:hypothetical protein
MEFIDEKAIFVDLITKNEVDDKIVTLFSEIFIIDDINLVIAIIQDSILGKPDKFDEQNLGVETNYLSANSYKLRDLNNFEFNNDLMKAFDAKQDDNGYIKILVRSGTVKVKKEK